MIPRNLQKLVQIELVNCAPRSELITEGTPKVGIRDRSKTLAHSSAVVDWRGIASGHPLILSTMVNKNVCMYVGGYEKISAQEPVYVGWEI